MSPIAIVNQMKDQVPVVLLNKWLEIEPERSRFTKKENCLANAEEYSVYSDETLSQALSIKGSSLRCIPKFNKRNSFLSKEAMEYNVLDNINMSQNRRSTIKNKDLNLEKHLSAAWENTIKEVDDKSDSESSGLERSSVTRSVSVDKRDREKRSSSKVN